ncbi:MAG TPA: tetratricopeptide repeat protein [Pyrinomonadaceae bacterium]|nr:tetratricopeptide repeat protein [Pyrinomonadaceae bacterium]
MRRTFLLFSLLTLLLFPVESPAQTPTTAAEFYNRGVIRQKSKDLDGALADYTRAIELDPSLHAAYHNRAVIRYDRKDFDGAIADADKLLALKPNFAFAYGIRGAARGGKGDFDGAIADIERAIQLDVSLSERLKPFLQNAYYNRGGARLKKKDLDGAIADFDRSVALQPGDVDAYRQRALARRRKSDFDGAIADYTKIIELRPTGVEAYLERGLLRLLKDRAGVPKDEAGAWADFTKATEIKPPSALAFYKRASDFYGIFHKRDDGAAVADYTRAIEIDPKFGRAYSGRALARERLARRENRTDYHKDVLVDLDKALELGPQSNYLYRHRAGVREEAGDLAGALADYTKQIELRENDFLQWSDYAARAGFYSRTRRHPEAVQDYARAIKHEPDLYWLHAGMGRAFLKMSKPQEARAAFEEAARLSTEAIRRAPDNALNHFHLAEVYADMGDHAAALKAVDKAIALDPRSNFYVLRARVRRESGDLNGVSADIDQAIARESKPAAAYLERGLTRLLQGRTAEAEGDFKKCVEFDAKCAAQVEEKVGEIKRKRARAASPQFN